MEIEDKLPGCGKRIQDAVLGERGGSDGARINGLVSGDSGSGELTEVTYGQPGCGRTIRNVDLGDRRGCEGVRGATARCPVLLRCCCCECCATDCYAEPSLLHICTPFTLNDISRIFDL